MSDDFLSVADVATLMRLSHRRAYELIRSLGVPCLGRGIDGVRFARADFEDARARAARPLPRRKRYGARVTAPTPVVAYVPSFGRKRG